MFHDTTENRIRVGSNAPSKQKVGVEENKKGKKRVRLVVENNVVEDDALGPDIRNQYDKNLQLITRACTLPFTLQTILVDDGEKITKRCILHQFSIEVITGRRSNIGESQCCT